jgi:hypothetical protein
MALRPVELLFVHHSATEKCCFIYMTLLLSHVRDTARDSLINSEQKPSEFDYPLSTAYTSGH